MEVKGCLSFYWVYAYLKEGIEAGFHCLKSERVKKTAVISNVSKHRLREITEFVIYKISINLSVRESMEIWSVGNGMGRAREEKFSGFELLHNPYLDAKTC